ncbi:PDZ and LIM domain protein Zasp isoform X2 [Aricia agestis]|uniref:PDZ and LIM domain protein Zasp isoform X2 n=1 Tax=Aricia agestis TaxID=91739 RepID=UPI001C206ABD|nr:PDZ and LIM domain protein Zasp isoform X2 [Aricia agestis]
MAQLLTVRLNKSDQQPLGFRLQGGKDFGTPLVVQKVNGGSAAERAGLQAGDALIRVNNTDVYTLRHQEAQDTIRAAGPMLELTVQRGGSTWRPSVTPTGSLPRPGSRPLGASPVPVTSTSLKATPQPSRAFGSGHNNVAKPFGYMNGSDSVKSIVNKQYNTPVNMYSDKTIAETLSAQTEVLAGGVLGVNFKKNEKTYDAEKSAVFKVLQEAENDPEPEPNPFYSRASVARAGTPSSLLRSHRSRSRTPRVETAPQPAVPRATTGTQTPQPEPERLAPEPPHRPSIPVGCHQVLPDGRIALGAPAQPPPDSALPVVKDTPHCDECYRYIVGVFVRIKDKNLHVECFKCSTCGTSLKNQGYYNINGKLYCDIHAKLVARQNPPALNLEPVTVPPGGRIPTNTYSTPLPPLATNNYTNGSSSLFSPSSNLSGPKPFGSSIGSAYSPSLSPRSGPVSPARPVNAPTAAPHMPFAPTKNVKSIVWPPPNPPEDEPSTQENIPNTCKPATTTDLSSKVPTESLLLQARNTSSSQAASEQLKSVAQVSATSTSQSTSEFSSNLSFSAASMSKAAATTSKVESIVESKQSQKVEQSSSCTVQSFSQQAASESQSVAVYQTNVTAQEAKKPNDQTISSIKSDIQKTIEESSNQMEQCAETKQSQVKKEETSNYNEEQQRSTQQKSENTNSNLLLAQKEETVSIQNEGLRDTNTTNQGAEKTRSRPTTPSLINKPAPIIPHYQMNLITVEHLAPDTYTYNPSSDEGSRSPTPKPRSRSPAQGPSGLKAQAPRIKEANSNLFNQVQQQATTNRQSNLMNVNVANSMNFPTSQPSIVKEERLSNVGYQTERYNQKDMSIKENSMYKQNYAQRQMESQNVSEYGNTTVQRTQKTFEEFERKQSAKVIEIRKGPQPSGSYQPIESNIQPSFINTKEVYPSQSISSTAFPKQNVCSNTTNKNVASSITQSDMYQTNPLNSGANQDPVCDPTPSTGSSVGVTPRGKNFGVSTAPRRGRGILNKAALPGSRVPLCGSCNGNIRGPFITALGRIWCPEHFICVNATCRRPLQDIGFVEENGQLYCEYCFEQYIAPACDKCHAKIKGDCLNAIGKHYHPECFICVYCGKVFGNNTFFLEDGLPYCEADWNELFTTKCFACGFPVEAGDRWVEALNNNYHSQCFNCTVCKKNLEGQSFFAKGGRPFCKAHAR